MHHRANIGAMHAIDFRDDVTSVLRIMSRNGVLRKADRDNLTRLLGAHELPLVDTVQRILLQQLEGLGLVEEFQEALKEGTSGTISYLKRTTPNFRMFLVNALEQALQEMSAAFSERPL
jgi:hypothetical protein